MEKDIDGYETKAKLCIEAHDDDIKEKEKLISTPTPQAVQSPGNHTVDQWTQFRPQSNLEATYLENITSRLRVP